MDSYNWSDLPMLGMSKDKGGRWLPSEATDDRVKQYLDGYRTPSRAWPNSYAKALMTKKFFKFYNETKK